LASLEGFEGLQCLVDGGGHCLLTGRPSEDRYDSADLLVHALPRPWLARRDGHRVSPDHFIANKPQFLGPEFHSHGGPEHLPQHTQHHRKIPGHSLLVLLGPSPVLEDQYADRNARWLRRLWLRICGVWQPPPASLPLGNQAMVALAALRRVILAQIVIAACLGDRVSQCNHTQVAGCVLPISWGRR
jgi:hypothetical protein